MPAIAETALRYSIPIDVGSWRLCERGEWILWAMYSVDLVKAESLLFLELVLLTYVWHMYGARRPMQSFYMGHNASCIIHLGDHIHKFAYEYAKHLCLQHVHSSPWFAHCRHGLLCMLYGLIQASITMDQGSLPCAKCTSACVADCDARVGGCEL